MLRIRNNIFETNSSSAHSIVILNEVSDNLLKRNKNKDSISQDIKNTIKDIIERYSESINCKIQKIENELYSYETAKRISECTKELQEKQLKYNDTMKMLSSVLAYGNPFPN